MLFAKKSPQNPQPCKLSLFCQIGFEARNIVGVDGSHEKDERSSRQCFQKAFCEDTSLLSDHLGEARTKFVGGLNLTSREGFELPPSALLLGGNLYITLPLKTRGRQRQP